MYNWKCNTFERCVNYTFNFHFWKSVNLILLYGLNFHLAYPPPSPLQSSKHVSIDLQIMGNGCHPGYVFSNKTQSCSCLHNENIVRCDSSNRYFYALVSPACLWYAICKYNQYFIQRILIYDICLVRIS